MARIRVHLYGDKHARRLLLQPVDSQELKLMDSEVEELTKLTGGTNWCLVAMEVHDWNKELSPWEAPAVFGDEPFGHDADRTLNDIIWYIHTFCKMYPGRPREFYLGGYSLAGFFALWTAYQTGQFVGIAAASPSVWFPGWLDYSRKNQIHTPRVYLSLGDKEEQAKNPLLASVGEAIQEQKKILTQDGVTCQLDWNPGNHFVDSEKRMAKGFAWLLTH